MSRPYDDVLDILSLPCKPTQIRLDCILLSEGGRIKEAKRLATSVFLVIQLPEWQTKQETIEDLTRPICRLQGAR